MADTPTFDYLEVACDGRRATLTLNRPERLNALSGAVMAEVVAAADWFDHQPNLRVASDDTIFSIPEVDLGIPLAWGGIPRLVREIGPALTKELVMTCRPFDAAEAAAAGFLNQVVPTDGLDAAVDDLAESVASRPRVATLATKAHTNAVTSQMVGTIRSWSDADGLGAAMRDPEARDSRAAYLERLRPGKPDRS